MSTSNFKRNNNKRGKAPRTKRTKNNFRGRSNRRAPRMAGAPVAVSEDLQQYTSFSNIADGIRMHTCAPAFQIFSTSITAQGLAAILPSSAGPARTAVQLNLTHPQGTDSGGTVADAEYVSPVWDLIASAFVRYRVRKCVFHYEPQSKSTADGRLVFAFAEDPLHPALWVSGAVASDLLSVADSIAFLPWLPWSMDVSHLMDDTKYYTFSDPSTTFSGFTERFSDWGVCACLTDAVAATPEIGGVLYLETEIDLLEFCPISSTRPSSAKRLHSKLAAVIGSGDRVRPGTKQLMGRSGVETSDLMSASSSAKCIDLQPSVEETDCVGKTEKPSESQSEDLSEDELPCKEVKPPRVLSKSLCLTKHSDPHYCLKFKFCQDCGISLSVKDCALKHTDPTYREKFRFCGDCGDYLVPK